MFGYISYHMPLNREEFMPRILYRLSFYIRQSTACTVIVYMYGEYQLEMWPQVWVRPDSWLNINK